MKRFLTFSSAFVLVLLIVITLFVFNKTELSNNGTVYIIEENIPVTFAVGDEKMFNDYQIRFESISNDSRCPSDVRCITAGKVEARFIIRYKGGKEETKKLNIADKITLGSSLMRLENVMPYPKSTIVINQKDYKATIIINKN